MIKEQLIEIIKKLLETDADLGFLAKLSKSELETLVIGTNGGFFNE